MVDRILLGVGIGLIVIGLMLMVGAAINYDITHCLG
jgi:hypothetical protein